MAEGCALLFWDNDGPSPGIFMHYYRGGPLAPYNITRYRVYWEDKYIAPYSAAMVWNHNLQTFQIMLTKRGESPNVKDIGINLESSCSSMLPLAVWNPAYNMQGGLLYLDGQTTACASYAVQDDKSTTDRTRAWPFGIARNVRDQLQPQITPLPYNDETTKQLLTHQWAFARSHKAETSVNDKALPERGFQQLASLPFSTRVYGLRRTAQKELDITTMPTSAFNNILVSPDFAWGDFRLDLSDGSFDNLGATMIAVQGSNPDSAPLLHVFWVDSPNAPKIAPGTGEVGGICTVSIELRDMKSGVYGEIKTTPGVWGRRPKVIRLGQAATTNRLQVIRVNDWIALYYNVDGKIMVTYAGVQPDGQLKDWAQPVERADGSLLAACALPVSVIPVPPPGEST